MEIQNLYALARQQNIEVFPFPLPQTGSMSIMEDSGACCIAMDDAVLDGAVRERVHLSHELGHCITGSFYNRYAAVDCRQRHENKANKWAIEALIPVDELDEAIADGCTEVWELADRFQVTEDFIRKAVCYYVHGNLADELYF
ncbi:MAG: ImmA/IrrE family metallo-endopeptidase [Oscillospiraceae bacterium]|nr:ImmA/IrrE family metallo-endopeptidase [Oscillospiraceae bacterium]MBQ7130621.1 ImmA/IrrE family metallo-endopeptidase [Oscillospiraceae bacterium]